MVSDCGGGRNRSPPMRIHKSILLLSTAVWINTLPAMALGQTNSPPSPEIAVHISMPKRVVTVGAVIHIEVRVSNSGDAATLVANTVSMASGGMAYLDFELTDAQGRVSPGFNLIADYPPIKPSDDNAATKLLGSWTLLYPHTSLLFDIPIDESIFKFLGKPGHYRLSATYASNGISYGRNGLGLSKEFLNSLPYPSWRGKVSTNEISLTVESTSKTRE
jgi:hypothetical protein